MYCVAILCCLVLMCNLNAGNNIRVDDANKNNKFDACVVRAVEKIFESEEVLYFIFRDYDILPFRMDNPKVTINASEPNMMHVSSPYKIKSNGKLVSTEYARNFIIQTKNLKSLEKIMSYLKQSAIWNHNESPRGTFLIITEKEEVERTFPMLWKKFIRNAVILVYNRNNLQNIPNLYSANSHEEGNACGLVAKVFSNQSCEGPIPNIVFKNPLRNYGGCSVVLYDSWLVTQTEKQKKVEIGRCMLGALRRYRNISIEVGISNRHDIQLIRVLTDFELQKYQLSYTFCQEDWVFVVPIPERIDGLKLYIFIFQKEIWILVAVSFLLTSLVWLLIETRKNNNFLGNISLVVFHVFSITVWGYISKAPKRFALRCLFLSYVIFCMHIQTAYVSMLIKVLTIPQFERGLNTLQELSDADVPLCITQRYVNIKYSEKVPNYEIYTKIQNKILILHNHTSYTVLRYIGKYNNCSTVTLRENVLRWEAFRNRSMTNKLIEGNSIMGPYNYHFGLVQGFYLVDTINEVIVTLKESGIYEKLINNVNDYYRKRHAERTTDFEPIVLGLNHLYGVFVIWSFGILISLIAFFGEVVISKWCRTT